MRKLLLTILLFSVLLFGCVKTDNLSATKANVESKLYIIETIKPVDTMSIENGERQKFYDSLLNETSKNLLYNLEVELKKENYDSLKAYSISSAISYVLPKETNAKTYEKIEHDINGDNELLKSYLIGTLGYARTKESLSILIKLMQKTKDDKMITNLNGAIVTISNRGESGRFPVELSPQFEKAWKEVEIPVADDNATQMLTNKLISYGSAIMAIGAPEGVELLLEDLEKSDFKNFKYYSEEKPRNSPENIKGDVVINVLQARNLVNPIAIPILQKHLGSQSQQNSPLYIYTISLMNMGEQEATKSVLDWAASREDDISPLLKIVIPLIRDEGSLKLAKDYSLGDSSKKFKNIANYEAMKKGYNDWLAARSS